MSKYQLVQRSNLMEEKAILSVLSKYLSYSFKMNFGEKQWRDDCFEQVKNRKYILYELSLARKNPRAKGYMLLEESKDKKAVRIHSIYMDENSKGTTKKEFMAEFMTLLEEKGYKFFVVDSSKINNHVFFDFLIYYSFEVIGQYNYSEYDVMCIAGFENSDEMHMLRMQKYCEYFFGPVIMLY